MVWLMRPGGRAHWSGHDSGRAAVDVDGLAVGRLQHFQCEAEAHEVGAFGDHRQVAGVEVPSLDGLPEGMVGWEIPEATYAVFEVPGLEHIHAAWDYVYGPGLAGLPDWVPDDTPCFELYPVEFPDDPVLYIYAPVKPKD